MSTKTTKIVYWVLLVIFCLFHIMDGIGGIMRAPDGVKALANLSLPAYLMPFLGTLKILGVIALLQNKFKAIKEWAFAGFSFSLIGATVANACAITPDVKFVIMPLAILVILLIVYYCWHKLEAAPATA